MKKVFLWLFTVVASGMFATSCGDDTTPVDDGKIDPSTIATSNLIAHFAFESETAAPANATGITYANKGASTTFVTGQRGKAFQANEAGTSYLVYNLASGNKLTTAKEYSLAFWMKAPKTDAARSIFCVNKGDGTMSSLNLFTDNSNNFTGDSIQLKTYLYNTTTVWRGQDWVSHSFRGNVWTYVVALYRSATSAIEFYANGVPVSTNVRYSDGEREDGTQPLLGELTLDPGSDKLYFGKWDPDANEESWKKTFPVTLDEFRIYNKALTAQEVKDLYDAEVSQLEE